MNYYGYLRLIEMRQKAKNLTDEQISERLYVAESTINGWYKKHMIMRGGWLIELLQVVGYEVYINGALIETYEDVIEEIKKSIKEKHLYIYEIAAEMGANRCSFCYWLNLKWIMRADRMLKLLEVLELKMELKEQK